MSNRKFDEISIPEDLDNIIENSVMKAVKYKKQKNLRRSSIAIAASIILMCTIGAVNPALAARIPILSNVFKLVEKNAYFPGNFSEYATAVNEKITSNGITVTVSDVFCDGQSLYVSYLVNSKDPFKDVKINTDPNTAMFETMSQLFLEYAYSKVSFSDKELPLSGLAGLEGYFIDNNTFAGMKKYDLAAFNSKIPEQFTVKLKISHISDRVDSDYVKGNWEFEIPVKVDKSQVKEIHPIQAEKYGHRIESIIITPNEVKVKTTHPKGSKLDDVFVKIYRAENNLEVNHTSEETLGTTRLSTFKAIPKDCSKVRVEIYTYNYPNNDGTNPIKVIFLNKEFDVK